MHPRGSPGRDGRRRGKDGRRDAHEDGRRDGRWRALAVRYASGVLWCYLVWNLLTWTGTAENLGVGFGVAMLLALGISVTGEIVPPWRLLEPRRLWGVIRLIGVVAWGIARKNVHLARLICSPSRPVRSGMVIAPTHARTDGEIATVCLCSSLIVDNQIIDIDRTRHQLQFHGVTVPPPDRRKVRAAINGPVEGPLLSITRR